MKTKRAAAVLLVVGIGLLAYVLLKRDKGESVVVPRDLPSVTFMVPEEGVEIARDYNQQVMIPIRNNGPGPARVRLSSDHFPDFPTGFVGRGTPDWEEPDTVLDIAPGEIWESPLLLHANHPQNEEYTVALAATQDGNKIGNGLLKVRIEKPKLELEVSWIAPETEIDQARLARRLKIRNIGSNIPDLSLRFEKTGTAPEAPIHLEPAIEQSRLHSGASVEVAVNPYLYASFRKLEGTLVVTGLGQETHVPYLAEVPEGQGVFVTLSRTTSRNSNEGSRCTNSPRATYRLPATSGTPSSVAWSETDGGIGIASGHTNRPAPGLPEEEEEPEEKASWSLFGPLSEVNAETDEPADTDPDADPKAEPDDPKDPDAGTGEDEETLSSAPSTNPDLGTFDLLDANTEGLVGGLVSNAFKVSKPPADGIEPVEEALDPEEKESSTLVDPDGKRTHMTRRRGPREGTEFVNFGWGIQGKGRRLGGRSVRSSGSPPRLAPNPRPEAPALLQFSEKSEEGNDVIKVLDPETGDIAVLSDPSKNADSPASLRTVDGVKTFFREDGLIRSLVLDEKLEASPLPGWPAGERTGPILAAEETPDGGIALLTREEDGMITFRDGNGSRPFEAASAALASDGAKTQLVLGDEEGALSVVDPVTGNLAHTIPGKGYGPPSLARTVEGGLRLFFGKEMPDRGTAEEAAAGTDLGGNFSADFKGGAWEEPRRVFLPEAPVTDAVVAVEVSAPFASAHYKKMDTDISFNGQKLQRIESEIPVGRYLYHVPTSALAYRSEASDAEDARNEVVIDAKGIGPGNFHLTDKCSVYGRHEWTQGCLVASSGGEADRIARQSNPSMRHDAHDLVLATNGARLPRGLTPGQKSGITVSAFNAGDKPSPAGEVLVKHEGFPVGKGRIPSLPEFRGAPLELDFTVPPEWVPGTSLLLTVDAPGDGDADPSTNVLELSLLKELEENIAGPRGPSKFDPGSLGEDSIVTVPSGEPFETPLKKGKLWFRVPLPADGELQLEVTGSGANSVGRIDLFDAEGNPLSDGSGRFQSPGDTLYLRLGYPPEESIPDDTNLKIWWE